MKRLFLAIILFFVFLALMASPCWARPKKPLPTEAKPEVVKSIEAIVGGSTMQARETDAVHVTIQPLKLIFTISF